MDIVLVITFFLAGLVAGVLIAILYFGRKLNTKEREIRELGAGYASAQTALELQKKELQEMQERLTLQFENMANRILENNSRKFALSNQENMEQLLKPLGEQLTAFRKKVEDTHLEETRQRSYLEERIKGLIEQTNKVSAQANNLADALKGQNKTQGNWGEMLLERILEQSGLEKDVHYTMQEPFRTSDGKLLYPDVVVHLPGERVIILDSKVSLLAYDRYVNVETSGDRDSALQDHLLSVRRHVDELASKQYDRFDGSLDFTMMFIPVEPAYLTAIKTDSNLWSYAYSRRILLISPTNLIACLKLMSDLWSREMQSRNAMQIAERGALLYDKFVGFVNSLESIGSNLAKSQEAYTAAMKQLREGNGNLMGQALKLRELGVKANKVLEKKLPE